MMQKKKQSRGGRNSAHTIRIALNLACSRRSTEQTFLFLRVDLDLSILLHTLAKFLCEEVHHLTALLLQQLLAHLLFLFVIIGWAWLLLVQERDDRALLTGFQRAA